jgi:DNA polymerase elongation subunit (family B)
MEDKPIIGKKALEITIELAKKAGALASMFLKDPHDLEYEKTFLPFCLLSKKRYVGILYEDDVNKGKRKSMGIVLKRRDNAPIVKDIYGGVIDILMKEQVVHKAVDFVKQSLEDVVNEKYSQQKLIITKSLRSYYKNPKQIAHNVLAMRIGEREQGNQPKPGDRIEFIYIENKDKKALQGEKIETPAFIEKNKLKIDYSFYITNQIMKPLQQVFALILEEMEDFIAKRGLSMKSWKADIEKLQTKWPEKEKFAKKYEEFRCKEVKSILFDQFINKVK